MMFDEMDEMDENYDPVLFDGIVDLDLNTMCVEQDSNDVIDSLKGWLFDCFPSSLETEPPCSPDDFSHVFSFDIPLNRKEWLVEDSISKRQRSPRLFEFLILLLGKPQYKCYASFADRSKGIFQIHQPEKVAELWQAVKSRQSNQRMTYDKFARAIRWYYKSNIMQKTNTRYTFQFSSQTLKKYFLDENNNTKMSLSS
ncbi:unnamed protein product [Rotaria sp. Silwood1]|nr:unnamed protein product [Rotaria sp. Silwood1]CAF1007744.1 unnamed protein product [Rotaria sp. Silwood1]CAF3388241.1 unnamed protein product [Rotaria sp. Silwood1]CAF3422397.1 unnamed protein product [Rotaria sp. Silwood1]CAF4860984.1 unnamed protein product [Rotaria sp. Silwood1]